MDRKATEYSIISEDGRKVLNFRLASVLPFKRESRRHHHADFEIACFKAGCGTYTVGKKQYDIKPGDVFLFSTDEVHCITEIFEGSNLEYSVIHFSPSFVWASRGMSDLRFLKIFFNRNDNFKNRLDRENKATAEIFELIGDIEREFKQRRSEYELMVHVKLLTILVMLIRDYNYVDENAKDIGTVNVESVEKALSYIDNHLDEELTLESIAFEIGMNKTYFSTLFKKLNGISPWEYITVRRVEKAIQLIKSSDANILDVALMCGYNSTANFNRAFKKITGKVPSEIRKQYRKTK